MLSTAQTNATHIDSNQPNHLSIAIQVNLQPSELTLLEPFLTWFSKNLKASDGYMLLAGLSAFLGGMATYNAYISGARFGNLVGNEINADPTQFFFITQVSGLFSYLPVAILTTSAVHSELNKLLCYISSSPVLPTKHNTKSRKLVQCIINFVALFCGMPFYAITKTGVPGYISEIIGGTTLAASYCVGRSGFIRLMDNLVDQYSMHSNQELAAKNYLTLHFTHAKNTIHSMKAEEISLFYDNLLKQTLGSAEQKLQVLHSLLKQNNETTLTEAFLPVSIKSKFFSYLKKGLSAAIAIGTTYSLRPYAAMAANWFANLMDISDQEGKDSMEAIFVVLSLAANSIFIANFVNKKFQIISDSISQASYCPSAKTTVATMIAGLSTTANIYLAIQSGKNMLNSILIICAILGPTFSRGLAFETLLAHMPGFFYKTYRTNSAEAKRVKLLEMIDKLADAIEILPSEQVILLSQALLNYTNAITTDPVNHIALEEKSTNQNEESVSHEVTFHY